ncbi:MAG: glycosyltransferase family 2 protein [Anaerolineales bacterium]|jgi:glycosyltransferase involved in cell wall biosynthesis|nr:glycosyltransferase family 2 protein [Anaerolineales bacterium]
MKPSQTSPKLTSLSVVLPAYNDGGTIPSMVLTSLIAARQWTDDFEIIVINDGSRDYTAEVLDELSERIPELTVRHHPKNQGYGAALRHGFHLARKDWLFYTDGDAQYNPLELDKLVRVLEPGIDIVNGYKIARNDPLHRKIIGKIYHHLSRLAFGFHLRDVDCDFRLIRRAAFDSIKLESRDGAICVEMVKKFQDAGFKFGEVPVNHHHRQYGKSQFFNWLPILRSLWHLTQLWWKLVVKKEHLR